MFSHNKMQLWYPKHSSDSNISQTQRKIRESLESYTSEDTDLTDADFLSVDSQTTNTSDTSRTVSPTNSYAHFNVKKQRHTNQELNEANFCTDKRNLQVSDFIDLNYWKEEKVCCGIIFRGVHDEIMIDPRFMKACSSRIRNIERNKENSTENIIV
ncbi:unnamed protein product [Psylliodes chrysocephalus]|uniref:Uncharacterized protein n=1 Tax=Psylliodes chrysocephalus TaxID=3402493 RepID=A0A9P0CP15_9CUCU|nr:unnamed protein product [Psylliodes chrysocephala]